MRRHPMHLLDWIGIVVCLVGAMLATWAFHCFFGGAKLRFIHYVFCLVGMCALTVLAVWVYFYLFPLAHEARSQFFGAPVFPRFTDYAIPLILVSLGWIAAGMILRPEWSAMTAFYGNAAPPPPSPDLPPPSSHRP